MGTCLASLRRRPLRGHHQTATVRRSPGGRGRGRRRAPGRGRGRGRPVPIPPLAAGAALVHSAPALPLAQPRSVILGHLIATAAGYGALAAAGVTLALNTPEPRTPRPALPKTVSYMVSLRSRL
ncbi:HPP family protein [Streptomyces sp. NPDC055254]